MVKRSENQHQPPASRSRRGRLTASLPLVDHRQRKLQFESLETRCMLATIIVDSVADNMTVDGMVTLREAVQAANTDTSVDGSITGSGADTIIFAAGLPGNSILLGAGQLAIEKSLTIQGPGAGQLTIDAGDGADNLFGTGDGHRVFLIDDGDNGNLIDVQISGLTLTGGDAAKGVDATGGSGEPGPGDPGEPGGAIFSLENLTIADSVITGNAAGRGGSGDNGPGFKDGGRGGAGGGIYSGDFGGALTIVNSSIINNAAGAGGNAFGVYFFYNPYDPYGYPYEVILRGGEGGDGGGIFSRGALTITSSTISNNAAGAGGDSYIGLSAGGQGGGLFGGVATLTGSTVNNNSTTGPNAEGGGIFMGGGTIDLSMVSGNTTSGAGSGGGGVFFGGNGSLTIMRSTVSGNSTNGSGSGGGGILLENNLGDFYLIDSTVSGNSATGSYSNSNGGGLFAQGFSSNATITNSTISGNTTNANGGGIYVLGSSMLIESSTITANTASVNQGGGIGVRGDTSSTTATLYSTIVSGNIGDDLAIGVTSTGRNPFVSQGYNLIGVGEALGAGNVVDAFNLPSDTTGVLDPGLEALAPNGGPTQTHAVTPTSPALDAGSSTELYDQRGMPYARLIGPGVDIGAFELQAPVVTVDTLQTGDFTPEITGTINDPAATILVDVGGQTGLAATNNGDGTWTLQDNALAPLTFGVYDVVATATNAAMNVGVDATTDELVINHVVVDTNIDEDDGDYSPGDLSLREAIALTNGRAGADLITFAATLSGQSVVLGGTEINITDALTIDATALTSPFTIDANLQSRVFDIDDPGTESEDFDVSLSGLTITGGKTTDFNALGGAIQSLTDGVLTIDRSTVRDSATEGDFAHGAGVFANGDVILTESVVSGNVTSGDSSVGGGVFSFGYVTLAYSAVIQNNTDVSSRAGGIYSQDGMAIYGSTISGNTTGIRGGGIEVGFGDVDVVNSTISNNTAAHSYNDSSGGGIYINVGNATISGSTVSGNTASRGGGVLANGNTYILNSTITGNSATGVSLQSRGGGLWGFAHDIRGSIVADNTAVLGSPDIYLLSSITVISSIIGDNAGTGLSEAQSPDANGNLIGSSAGAGVIDPLIAPLADNGGPTQTHALLPGSPALDAGPVAIGPLYDYQLNGSYYDELGAGSTLVDLGGELTQTSYLFGGNEGLEAQVPEANADHYSLELRLKLDTITPSSGYQQLIDFSAPGFPDAGLYVYNDRLRYLAFDNGASFWTATPTLSPDTWYHLVLTRNSNGLIELYLDGEFLRTLPTTGAGTHELAVFSEEGDVGSRVVRLFHSPSGFGVPAAGEVDRVRFYDAPLTAAEVQASYVTIASYDQRGAPYYRVANGRIDIGAFELQLDSDGVSDVVEDGAPNGGDGNMDGIADSEQSNVASLPNSETQEYVTLAAPAGITLQNVSTPTNPSPGDAPNVDFPLGFFEFGLAGLAPGQATTVELIVPAGSSPPATYYKYGPEPSDTSPHWYEFLFDGSTGAEILSDRVVLHFVDGQRGDSDLAADGVVTDPGSPAAPIVVNPGDFNDDGDVDGFDFLQWQRGFGTLPAVKTDGDADNDADVDADDLTVWQDQYGQPAPLFAVEEVLTTSSYSPESVFNPESLTTDFTLLTAAQAWAWVNLRESDSATDVIHIESIDEVFATSDATIIPLAAAEDASEMDAPTSNSKSAEAEEAPWLSEELLERVFG